MRPYLGPMRSMLHGIVLSFVLGLYRSWDGHAPLVDRMGAHVRHRPTHPLDDPARTFFWGMSSLAN